MTGTEILYWALALVGHAAFWVEAVNRLHGMGWHRRWIDAGTMACAAAVSGVPLVALGVLIASDEAPSWLVCYANASLAALAVIVAMRIGLKWDPQLDRRTRVTGREVLDLGEMLGDQVAAPRVRSLAGLPGNQLVRVALEKRTIPIDGLPPALEGLKIAHLTDLHMSGRLGVGYYREVVRAVNAWSPDLLCVTGDIVEHTPQLDWIDEVFGGHTARLGGFFVLGNHDDKIDSRELRRRLIAVGLVDVGGRVESREHNGAPITLYGDERPWFDQEPPLAEGAGFALGLAHTPDRFGWAVQRGVELLLAGHNHGGQVCFPLLGPLLCPSRHGVRYADGTFRSRGTVMHAGRGTGSLFPLRYNCPPEVGLLTLTAG